MRAQFFKPIPVTFTQALGAAISEADLLHAWRGWSADQVRALPLWLKGERVFDIREGWVSGTRARVIALKEAGHG